MQVGRRPQVDRHTKQVFKFYLQATQIKERCTRLHIDQKIKVAAIEIGAVQCRAEDARIDGPMPPDSGSDGEAVCIERHTWFHWDRGLLGRPIVCGQPSDLDRLTISSDLAL